MTGTLPTKRKPVKRKTYTFQYLITFGDDTAADPGKVLFRVSRDGAVLLEEHMDPGEFLQLADAFESQARGLRNVLDGRPVG